MIWSPIKHMKVKNKDIEIFLWPYSQEYSRWKENLAAKYSEKKITRNSLCHIGLLQCARRHYCNL